jgi:dihydroneopterin aldolase
MRDRIEIHSISAHGFHGVYPEERKNGQRFLVDLSLTLKSKKASKSDLLEDAIDYSKVIAAVNKILSGDPVNLIEHLAEVIAEKILKEFPVKSVEVVVHKPDAAVGVEVGDIAVRIIRSK